MGSLGRPFSIEFVLLVALTALVTACTQSGGGGGSAVGGQVSATTLGPTPAMARAGTWGVTAVDPAPNQTFVTAGQVVRVTFGQAPDALSVDASSFRVELAGRAITGKVAVAANAATFTPLAAFASGQTYEVRVTIAVRSVAGQPLGQDVVWRFSTDPAAGARGPVFFAGAAAVDITPPIGVPLSGYGEGERRLSFPDLWPWNYHTFFAPSIGIHDPILAKALVLDDGVDRVVIVTLDLIGSDMRATRKIADKLAQRGVAIDPDHIMTAASHTHSGPGTVSNLHFWEIAAADLYQPQVFDALISKVADAIELAVADLQPARLALGSDQLTGITKNRRVGVSPHYTRSSIDPELGVLRIDRPDGTAIATVYNYAIHGLAYWWDNMKYSADLMGDASRRIEAQVGGIALFCNSAEGDIVPERNVAQNDADRSRILGQTLGDAVIALRTQLAPDPDVDIKTAYEVVDMGPPYIYVNTNQLGSVPPFVQSVLNVLGGSFGMAVPLGPSLLDQEYRYQAIRIQNSVLTSIPGEAIHELGLMIKADGRGLGYDHTFCIGLANGHMAYITTAREYAFGGYEGIATFFGPQTGDNVQAACRRQMQAVR